MQPRDLELLLVLNNKSNYNEKDFQNEIEYLMINKYIYRKGGCMNLTDKAKDFIKRQVKEKPDVEDLMNCTDHLLRIKIVILLMKWLWILLGIIFRLVIVMSWLFALLTPLLS